MAENERRLLLPLKGVCPELSQYFQEGSTSLLSIKVGKLSFFFLRAIAIAKQVDGLHSVLY